MIVIVPVHRRMAELTEKMIRGNRTWGALSKEEQSELFHCLIVHNNLVHEVDKKKELAYLAHCAGDLEWQMDLCAELEALEFERG